jgi:uncharacterized membrane protein YvbJ
MAKVKCVHCGKRVFEMAAECPYCKQPIANPHAPTKVSAAPWTWKKESHRKKMPAGLIIVVVLILVAAAVYYFMAMKP